MNKAIPILLACSVITACQRKSPTEVARMSFDLCGAKTPFESILSSNLEGSFVEEKPVAGRDTWNVIYGGQHRVFSLYGEIKIQVSEGQAIDFDGQIESILGDLVVPIAGKAKDALCAGELTKLIAGQIREQISESMAKAAVWKLAIGEHYAYYGRLPESKNEIEDFDTFESLAIRNGSNLSQISIGPSGKITIGLPSYFWSTGSAQFYLSPNANGSRLEWVCSSNLNGEEIEATPASCRTP